MAVRLPNVRPVPVKGERSETPREGPPASAGVGSRGGPLTGRPAVDCRISPKRKLGGMPRGERRVYRQLPLPGMPSFLP
jgi:hypothetical protein